MHCRCGVCVNLPRHCWYSWLLSCFPARGSQRIPCSHPSRTLACVEAEQFPKVNTRNKIATQQYPRMKSEECENRRERRFSTRQYLQARICFWEIGRTLSVTHYDASRLHKAWEHELRREKLHASTAWSKPTVQNPLGVDVPLMIVAAWNGQLCSKQAPYIISRKLAEN